MTLTNKTLPIRGLAKILAQVLAWGMLGLGCAEAQTAATVDAPPRTETGLSLALSRGSMRYQSIERSATGFITNQENGKLPTLAATLRWQDAPTTAGHWFAQARYGMARNEIDYQGYTQFGFPLQTATQLDVRQLNLHGGYDARLGGNTSAQLRLGLDRLYIDRLIQPALGSLPLQEVMTSDRVALGVGLRHTWPDLTVGGRTRPLSLQANIEALRGLRQTLDVNTFGVYDNVRLQPARSTDWRWHVGAQWQVWPQVELGLGYAQERFGPGVSAIEVWRRNGTPVVGVRYPGSQQQLQTVDLSLRYRF